MEHTVANNREDAASVRPVGAGGLLVSILLFNHRALAQLIRHRHQRAYWIAFALALLGAGAASTALDAATPALPTALTLLAAAADALVFVTPFALLRDYFYKLDNAQMGKVIRAGALLWLITAAIWGFAGATAAFAAPETPAAVLVWGGPLAVIALWAFAARYVVMVRLMGLSAASLLAAIASVAIIGAVAKLLA